MDPTAPPLTPVALDTEVDQELLALPAPPKGQRTVAMVLMAAVVGLALGLLSSVRSDLSYALQSEQALVLGDAVQLDPAKLPNNAYVRVRGTPMLSGMVRFETGLWGSRQVVFPLAGQRNVFVQVAASTLEDPRTAARTEFAGRMVTFGELGGRFRVVREFLAQHMGLAVTAETFLIIADDPPATHVWALVFGAFCLGVVGLNVWLFSRWFRPLRRTREQAIAAAS
ncbi:MAG TPA: hypothetical protein VJR89_04970 [Polyangiales bacterium]|nr:hypothetical protein [Polyangiales bacterium]